MGVRSFSNRTAEVIQFFTPLTLIVGLNGSGKTTIIESLKYATIGEFPGGAKQNGAWIHDPKLCGEKEVLAQVRLSFVSTKGHRMFLSRNLCLTVTRASRSMKALESTLSRRDQNGEKLVISSKVGELEKLVPEFLGVSKAVLDNVIFCHQEDSLWPMAVPSDLKKKFDDIFEAVKYTQAVDNIKKLRKEFAEKLKQLKLTEGFAKDYKDKGAKLERESSRLHGEIEATREELKELGAAGDATEAELKECFTKINELSAMEGELVGNRIRLQTKQESIQKDERNLTIMTETDAELEAKLASFDDNLDSLRLKKDSQTKRWHALTKQLETTRGALSSKERELGSLEGQKADHERQIEARDQLIKQIAREHSIRGFDLDLDQHQVTAFKDRLIKMIKEQSQAVDKVRAQINEDLRKSQDVLSAIKDRKTAMTHSKNAARQAIDVNDSKIRGAQREHDQIEVDEGAKAVVEASIADVTTKLKAAKANAASSDWDRQLMQANNEIAELEARADALNAEMMESTKRTGDASRLQFLQKELSNRAHSLQSMESTHGDQLQALLGSDWTMDNLERDFQQAISAKSIKVIEATRERDGLGNELEQLNFKLKTCRADLKRKNKEMDAFAQSIKKALDVDPDDFPDRLNSLEQDGDIVSNNLLTTATMSDYFKQSIDTANKHASCRLCQRSFDKQDKQLQDFLKRLQKNFDRLQENPKDDSNELLEELKTARGLSPSYESWKRVHGVEIPQLQEEEKRLVVQSELLTSTLEQQDSVVRDYKEAHSDVERQTKTIQGMLKYYNESHNLTHQISELQVKQVTPGQFRGLDQIQDAIKLAKESKRAAKATSNKITSNRERSLATINTLELELRDLHSRLDNTSYQLKNKLALERQITELKNANNEHRQVITQSDQGMQALGPELGEAQAAYDEIVRQGEDRERAVRKEKESTEGSLNRLNLAMRQIDDYLARDGPAQLHRAKFSIDSMNQEIKKIEQEQVVFMREIKAVDTQLNDNADVKRSISDNLDHRRDLRDVKEISKTIAELEGHNVEHEKVVWENKRKHVENQRLKLSAKINMLGGQISEKDARLKQNLADWTTDYKDAAYKFKEAHIRVETTKAAVEDLGRYGGALENAVMKYHTLKMEEVNRIIDELWRKTYMGTDVDTILIKSENENLKGGKSYKYRVCMVKQDVEMDMRGRCSAGQKVLASIIIRLALAECFGVTCGLIALDEPTTNLDRDNIEALAKALAEIIRLRREQSNFQLIVITHDEEFLKFMQCSDYTDSYYRVSRSANQDTEIHKQSIGQVMA